MRKAIELSKNKQLCRKLMEEKKYEEVFSIIKHISFKDLRKNTDWMLLYVWLHTKVPNCGVDKEIVREFIVSIGVVKMSLMQNPVYFLYPGIIFFEKESKKTKLLYFLKGVKNWMYLFIRLMRNIKKCLWRKNPQKQEFLNIFQRKKRLLLKIYIDLIWLKK